MADRLGRKPSLRTDVVTSRPYRASRRARSREEGRRRKRNEIGDEPFAAFGPQVLGGVHRDREIACSIQCERRARAATLRRVDHAEPLSWE